MTTMESPTVSTESSGPQPYEAVFTIWNTRVRVRPAILAYLFGLWGLQAWLAGRGHPERPWLVRILVGLLSTIAMMAADLGHAMAHTVSARYAGAPMDEILLSEGMPRTLYYDNDVPPRVHRLRALGGPIYNVAGLAISCLLRGLAPRGSWVGEVAGWSCLGHGLILGGSLVPLPVVDGGTMLKWTLVERGRTPEQADEIVRQVDLSLGTALTATGVALAAAGRQQTAARRWLPVLGLLAAGAIGIAAGRGKIR
ncbi:MAG: hypothetical protein ACK2UU_18965 [Anaerolineae bacterium]